MKYLQLVLFVLWSLALVQAVRSKADKQDTYMAKWANESIRRMDDNTRAHRLSKKETIS